MMSILKKIVLFPISLFVAFLALMARWLLTLSSYVVAPLMLYIFGCGIYTAHRQTWDLVFYPAGGRVHLLYSLFRCNCHHRGHRAVQRVAFRTVRNIFNLLPPSGGYFFFYRGVI